MNQTCEDCAGKCCKCLIVWPANEPSTVEFYETTRGVCADGFALVNSRCQHLTEDNQCGIYEARPEVCRKFEVDGPDCLKTKRMFELLQAKEEA